MGKKNKWREAKLALGLNKCLDLPKTLDDDVDDIDDSSFSSPSAGESARSSAAVSGDSTRPGNFSPASSVGLRSSKNLCAICLADMKGGKGEAIFTAECSHSFHFQCITSNVKHGNRVCPLCRFQWKQVPLGGNSTSSVISPQDDALPSLSWWSGELFHVPEHPVFDDDEFLPHGGLEIENGRVSVNGCSLEVKIKLCPEVNAVPKSACCDDFAVLINLKVPGESEGHTRAPIDLITVVDVSGSMVGIKIALLKCAMAFLIQNLGPTDRLSVITFSSNAYRLFPLRLMSESGKQEALQAVESLFAGGETNIADGLRIGAKVIADRTWKNPVSAMMLLSDGQDSHTHSLSSTRVHLRTNYESLIPSSCQIPIHTFGFGLDHDAELLHTVSDISGGTFSFIETANVIQDAFAQCIGGLLSIMAQELRSEIECVHPSLQIGSIKAGSYRISADIDGRIGAINVGDMYAEEERDFLVILKIPEDESEIESMSLLKVNCVYKDPITKATITSEAREVTIKRPHSMTITDQSVVSTEVDKQRNRFLVAEAMSEARVLAEQGELNQAVSVLETRRRELSQTVSAQAGDRLCEMLSAELLELQERMANRLVYESTGRAYVLSSISSHLSQRATARGHSTEILSPVQSYQTSAMAKMVTRSQQLVYVNPNPNPNPSPSPSPSPNLSRTQHVRRRLQKTLSFSGLSRLR